MTKIKPRLGIDIDTVVVDLSPDWDLWLMDKAGVMESRIPPPGGMLDYNLGKYYPEVTAPLDFWGQTDLYDTALPVVDAVEYLSKLSHHFDLVYISHITGNHYVSKVNFIKRHLPEGEIIATKAKHLVDVNIMIDDRLSYLMKFKPKTHLIWFYTIYSQDLSIPSLSPTLGWKEVYNECLRVINYLK